MLLFSIYMTRIEKKNIVAKFYYDNSKTDRVIYEYINSCKHLTKINIPFVSAYRIFWNRNAIVKKICENKHVNLSWII